MDDEPVSQETLDLIRHTARRIQQVLRDSVELMDDGDDAVRALFYILDDLAITAMVAVIPKLKPENRNHAYALKLVLATINHTASADKPKKFFADSVAEWQAQVMLQRIIDGQSKQK